MTDPYLPHAAPSPRLSLPEPTDSQRLRAAFGRFPTGVCVVAYDGPERRGITVNSFTSVSMDPPLLLISLDKRSASYELMNAQPFSVNVLDSSQRALAMHFAGRPDPDLTVNWVEGDRAPRLPGVLAWFECEPFAQYDAGDHILILGRIVAFDSRRGDALGFNGSRFTEIVELDLGYEHMM